MTDKTDNETPTTSGVDSSDLFKSLDDMVCQIDLEKWGPTGVNLSTVRRALDNLAKGARSGMMVTVSTARYLQRNGWDVGFD